MLTKKKKKCTENVCVKIRKSFMEETLDYLKKIREEMEQKEPQKQIA